jgi:Protein of unknown function (DUF2281)
MKAPTNQRQHLIEIVSTLPEETLTELANFVDYLAYKSTQCRKTENNSSAFLLSIAGLGTSTETNISERDEEILQSEVDPIRGWSLRSDDLT